MIKIDLKLKKENHFIGAWQLDNTELCNEIINFFNKDNENHKHISVLEKIKGNDQSDFIRLIVSPNRVKEENLEIIKKYIENLMLSYQQFLNDWDFFQKWDRIYLGDIFIDKFLLSGHNKRYHCDRDSIDNSHKMLSWITFLNDLDDDEGLLSFKYLNIDIKPKKGLTLIWPSDWTHTYNEGQIKKNEKYVIRGNIHYPDTLMQL